MKFRRPRKKPLIALLVKRTVFFFFFASIFIILLYAVGTVQDFMENTQIILLRLLVITGLFLSIAAVYGSLLNVGFLFIKRQKQFFLGIIPYLLLIVFGVSVSAAASFLLVIIGGNIN